MEDMTTDDKKDEHRRRSFFRKIYRWWYGLFKKSLATAVVLWMTTMTGGIAAIIYGCVTGPGQLSAQGRSIDSLQKQFIQAGRERTDTRDLIYWLASKECLRIPIEMTRYGVDADACGRVAHRSGKLFAQPDTFPR